MPDPQTVPPADYFLAEHIKDGDRYELFAGTPVYCHPAGEEHARAHIVGAKVLETDPDVEWAGADPGFTPAPDVLYAPDVAVSTQPEQDGWIPGAPLLALEYAARGQDKQALRKKIADFLALGTRFVWVVHLTGPRRMVEVHTPDQPVRKFYMGDVLEAPGVLRNPVPVSALYDAQQANEAVLRNLLQRKGFDSLEAVRIEGRDEGIAEGTAAGMVESIFSVLAARGLTVDVETAEHIRNCHDIEQLRQWLHRAATETEFRL